jgi:hypothetical protein
LLSILRNVQVRRAVQMRAPLSSVITIS